MTTQHHHYPIALPPQCTTINGQHDDIEKQQDNTTIDDSQKNQSSVWKICRSLNVRNIVIHIVSFIIVTLLMIGFSLLIKVIDIYGFKHGAQQVINDSSWHRGGDTVVLTNTIYVISRFVIVSIIGLVYIIFFEARSGNSSCCSCVGCEGLGFYGGGGDALIAMGIIAIFVIIFYGLFGAIIGVFQLTKSCVERIADKTIPPVQNMIS